MASMPPKELPATAMASARTKLAPRRMRAPFGKATSSDGTDEIASRPSELAGVIRQPMQAAAIATMGQVGIFMAAAAPPAVLLPGTEQMIYGVLRGRRPLSVRAG